ncbi:hypothetical protein [Vibrio parahaemolyticus]|uniref:hypothetical protein n=1 Tax=Vibrio parahaemolyticus TaxID=670 RepID=UPI0038921B23
MTEQQELQIVVNEIGISESLSILKSHTKKKRYVNNGFNSLPVDIRAKAVVLILAKNTQVRVLEYINQEIEKQGLDPSLKMSYTALNRYLRREVFPIMDKHR